MPIEDLDRKEEAVEELGNLVQWKVPALEPLAWCSPKEGHFPDLRVGKRLRARAHPSLRLKAQAGFPNMSRVMDMFDASQKIVIMKCCPFNPLGMPVGSKP